MVCWRSGLIKAFAALIIETVKKLIFVLFCPVLPSAAATPTSQELSAGETAVFDCVTSGDPTPQVRWLNAASVDVMSLSDSRIEVKLFTCSCIGGSVI